MRKLKPSKLIINNLFLLSLVIIGFFYRLYGLSKNCSFWTDENNLAIIVRAILERGKPVLANGFNTGLNQWLLYWLDAGSMKMFGINELGVRLPTVIFGTLTIAAVYLLAEKMFNRRVALLSAFFITFLNIEILWSRQARPYQIVQFFWLLGSYFSFKFIFNNDKKSLLFAVICGVTAELFHPVGTLFFLFQLIFLLSSLLLKTRFHNAKIGIGVFFLLVIQLLIVFSPRPMINNLGKINNFFYYRVFLINNYLSLVLFAFAGILLLIKAKKSRELFFLLIPIGVQLFIVSFASSQPFTRYFYPVFPFIVLSASYGILEIGNWLSAIVRKFQFPGSNFKDPLSSFLIIVVVFSLWKTDKLSFLPKKVYSLNADMQEIPEVDWKEIYNFVAQKLKKNPEAILAANWNDLSIWYLGEDRLNYLVRSETAEKDSFSGAYVINSLDKFIQLLKTKESGVFVLDSWDNIVPDGIREYCHKNLKREMEVDRLYPIQPRYWTVWIYSWGM